MNVAIEEVGESGGRIAVKNEHGWFSQLFGMSTLSNIRAVKESLQQCRRDIRACAERLAEGNGKSG